MLKTRIGGCRDLNGQDDATDEDESKEGTHVKTVEAFELCEQLWPLKKSEVSGNAQASWICAKEAVTNMQKELKKSLAEEGSRDGTMQARVSNVASASSAQVYAWLNNLRQRRENGRPVCNAKQVEVVSVVVDAICQQHERPLLWLVHGGPGTGKSHVVNLIRTEVFEREHQ